MGWATKYDLRYISFIDVPSMSWDVVQQFIFVAAVQAVKFSEVRSALTERCGLDKKRAEVKGFCKFPVLHLKIFEVICFQTNLS